MRDSKQSPGDNLGNEVIETPLTDGGLRFVCESGGDPQISGAVGWAAPSPLPSDLPAVLPFDFDILPETLRPWVQDVAQRMQCPPDFTAVSMIVSMGAVLGGKIAIRPKQHDDWYERPNIWGMIIGQPGLLKTPAIEQGLAALNHLDGLALKKHDAEMADYKIKAMLAAECGALTKRKIAAALKDGQHGAARLEAENAVQFEAKRPIRRRFKVNDPTVEKLAELLNENPNGLLLHRDELVGFLRTLDKEGREDSRAFFLESWTGKGDFTTDRIGRGTVRVEALIISILGSIQPGPLCAYLREAVRSGAGDDGLLQRFQLAVWPDLAPDWENVDRRPNQEAKDRVFSTFEHLDFLRPGDVGADLGEEIPFLRFGPEAQAMFDEWHRDLEVGLRSDRDHPVLQAHLAKYRKLVPVLSLILHLANRQVGPVTSTALGQSLRWSRYLESHARRIYASVRRPDEAAARELAKHLRCGALSSPFLFREVYRKGWTGLDKKEDVEPAIEVLCELNWIRPTTFGPPKNGRPPGPAFEINPLIRTPSKVQTAKSVKTSTSLGFDTFGTSNASSSP